jgi:tubulin polyglutamylase TTLL1
MSLRPWWTIVEEDSFSTANFVWNQFKNSEFFQVMPTAYEREKVVNLAMKGQSVVCRALFEDCTNAMRNVDISCLNYDRITKSQCFIGFEQNFIIDPCTSRMQNKLEYHYNLSDKKSLYCNMKIYYERSGRNVFENLPLTFHISGDLKDVEEFKLAAKCSPKTLWIVKPGENTNRGNGIFLSDDSKQILAQIEEQKGKNNHSFIIQKYIERPFLINRRKFDIRLYAMITSINGVMQAYYYREGYLRTASKVYSTADMEDKYIHLTNDAIQKNCEGYGKFENGNKLSYKDFQKYLDSKRAGVDFQTDIVPKLKEIIKDTIKATQFKLNKDRRLLNFEIFGYDFLLDANLKPWLLEVNTNPCLELSSTILARIIPAMIENALKIALDPLFPEPNGCVRKSTSRSQDLLPENKFELIFHQENTEPE